jgi:hypothetical protein
MRSLTSALLFAALAALPSALTAQRVLGPSVDATTLRRGTLRTTLSGDNILLSGRWNDGQAQELGAGLSVDLGPDAHPALGAIRDLLTGLSLTGVTPSLGRTRVDLRQRLAVTRLGFEYGVSDRISFKVAAPFVRVRAEAQWGLDAASSTAGINPSLNASGVATSNRAVVDAYNNAVASLTTRRDNCAMNAGSHPECATIIAEAALVNAAISRGTQFATALTSIYGAQGLDAGLQFVPMAGSPVQAAIAGVGDALRTDFTRWGVTDVTAGTGLPTGAQVPLTAGELAQLITDAPPEGYGTSTVTRANRQDLGDIDVGLTVNVYDGFAGDSARLAARTFGWRQSFGVTYRMGGGNFDLPDNLIDLGTGSGHDAIALYSYTDFIVNAKWWTTVALGWALGAEHERVIRVPLLQGVDLIGSDRQVPVRVTPAAMLELRVSPRYHWNDYISLGADWRYRTRGEDDVVVLGAPAVLMPSGVTMNDGYGAMNTPSNSNEQRFGFTLTYSTLASNARGNARLPLEIGYTHEQSVGSSRGVVPRRWEDRLQIRYYTRFFGR